MCLLSEEERAGDYVIILALEHGDEPTTWLVSLSLRVCVASQAAELPL